MTLRCDCGDPECASCGTAQGTYTPRTEHPPSCVVEVAGDDPHTCTRLALLTVGGQGYCGDHVEEALEAAGHPTGIEDV